MLIRITKNNDLGNKEAKQYQTNKQLGSQIFNINIYLTLQDILFVSAYNEKSSEMYLIELPKPKSLEVLANFGQDYNYLCDNLDIQKNRLVILNPNRKRKPGPK
mmetsp:Transcript_18204/g.17320  ORF Transcript_18204/g.17320 Transcript_18204/m.17320 type:complete len:104 (+) Transcript_18204:706-1017(+)